MEKIKMFLLKKMFKYKQLEYHTLSNKNRKKYTRRYNFYKFLFNIFKERK